MLKNIDPEWQVIIGSAIGTLFLTIWGIYRGWAKQERNKNQSKKLAIWSIVFGLLGLIFMFVASAIGIALGVVVLKNNNNKALSRLGIFLSILTSIPWFLILIFGT